MINQLRKLLFLSVICMLAKPISVSSKQLIGDTFKSANQSKVASLIYVYQDVAGFISTENSSQTEEGLLVEMMREFEAFVYEKKGIKIEHKFLQVKDQEFSLYLEQIKNKTFSTKINSETTELK